MTTISNKYKVLDIIYFVILSIKPMIIFVKENNHKICFSLYIFFLTMSNHIKIHRTSNTNLLMKQLFSKKISNSVSQLNFRDLEKIYFDLAKATKIYNCFDYAVLFAQIYSKKRKNVKLVFGILTDNGKISGHAWVELGIKRYIDFTGAYIYCKKMISYTVNPLN